MIFFNGRNMSLCLSKDMKLCSTDCKQFVFNEAIMLLLYGPILGVTSLTLAETPTIKTKDLHRFLYPCSWKSQLYLKLGHVYLLTHPLQFSSLTFTVIQSFDTINCGLFRTTLNNFFFWAQQPPVGQGLLIHEVSRSHTTTHHSR